MPTKPEVVEEEVKEEAVEEIQVPEGFEFISEPSQNIKQVIRHMAAAPMVMPKPEEGLFDAREVDDYLSHLSSIGYKIHTVHYLGRSAEGGHVLYYLLVKEESTEA